MNGNYLRLYLLSISSCFVYHTVAREAIIGGDVFIQPDKFPYQVSVQVHGHGFVCGGGIIDDRFILTAAHCVLNRDRKFLNSHISIHAGTTNYHTITPPAVTVKVEKIFFPAEFQPGLKNNNSGDIALLKVDKTLGLSHLENLGKLKLPRQTPIIPTITLNNKKATIAGFGSHIRIPGNRFGSASDGFLRYAKADLLSTKICKQVYPDRDIRSERHLCARLEQISLLFSTSVCTGDDGSPLVQDGTVIGILSRIPPTCNEIPQAGVYTRVAYYRNMIDNSMQEKNHSDMIAVFPWS